jgi:hypothetical protein
MLVISGSGTFLTIIDSLGVAVLLACCENRFLISF